MRVVVDNSTGGDEPLAQRVVEGLREVGFSVEVVEPSSSMFDTAVHLVTTGIVLRVDERPTRLDLSRSRRSCARGCSSMQARGAARAPCPSRSGWAGAC